MWSTFVEVAKRHLDSPPGGLEDLHEAAELWAFNTDFSLEFPQPLLPFTVLVGGLLNHPAKAPEQVWTGFCQILSLLLSHSSSWISLIPQDLELWISSFGDAGFIIVTLGSMVSSISVDPLLTELVAGFSRIPQGVLWR